MNEIKNNKKIGQTGLITEVIMNQSRMPVMFVGHGSPMNAIEPNHFTQSWKELFSKIPKPDALLFISAHYTTPDISITVGERQRTIHDFYGFPKELYDIQYPAKGSPELVNKIIDLSTGLKVMKDSNWGLDHGTWSVLLHIYPNADVPVVQISLNLNFSIKEHFEYSKRLKKLREENIIIIGSGNLVHNLGLLDFSKINTSYSYDWAVLFNNFLKQKIYEKDYDSLIQYLDFGKEARLSIPTPEHYLPALYILGMVHEEETVEFFNDEIVGGSISMTSFIVK